MMKNYPVASSAIRALVYDDKSERCHVTFTDGSSYSLEGLPKNEFRHWLNAPSVGRYWNANIRGQYWPAR